MSLNLLEQKLTNIAQKDFKFEYDNVDSGGLYINPRENTLTRKEVITNLANRIIHSKKYTIFYTFVIVLSLILLAMTFTTQCLPNMYIVIDYFINISFIFEVILRVNALGKNYWNSILNVIDLIILPLCVVTVIYLSIDDCSNKGEKIADNIILGVRNGLQLFRLLLLIKNNELFSSDNDVIDFDSIDQDNREAIIEEIISDSGTIDTGGDDIDFLIEYEKFEREISL